jgi:DNA-binding Lrp family transcriptional regulator
MDANTTQMLQLVAKDPRNVASRLAESLGMTRQAASARLLKAIKAGFITREGHGAGVRYALQTIEEVQHSYTRAGLSEDRVWQALAVPVLVDVPEKARDVWRYGLTEMINNAVDHSGSELVHVGLRRNALFTQAWVTDDGEGIFLRIQRALDLFDPREAILELAKGKFTTDPANHSGEGIFFSSKVFDVFDIRSGKLHFAHDDGNVDVLFERSAEAPGTTVFMQLANDTARTTREVFDKFAAPEEYTFAKTLVPVRLAQHEGEKLVSRSQAKRLTMRFERFQTVVLDFVGVAEIGQAFADEVFRVFQSAHPKTSLVPVNMEPSVSAMVTRAKAALNSQS